MGHCCKWEVWSAVYRGEFILYIYIYILEDKSLLSKNNLKRNSDKIGAIKLSNLHVSMRNTVIFTKNDYKQILQLQIFDIYIELFKNNLRIQFSINKIIDIHIISIKN